MLLVGGNGDSMVLDNDAIGVVFSLMFASSFCGIVFGCIFVYMLHKLINCLMLAADYIIKKIRKVES